MDLTNRTALVKAEVPNPNGDLKPGMFANLDLTVTVRENAVVIPKWPSHKFWRTAARWCSSWMRKRMRNCVRCKLGVRLAGLVEVEGVKAGERVIVEGTQKTVPGKPVQLRAGKGRPRFISRRTTAIVTTNTASKS